MALKEVTVTLSGRFFAPGMRKAVIAGINEGLEQVALKGQALVQAQLTPGHGVRTGHFRRSVHGALVKDLHAQVDAGLHAQGRNVVYTNWLEGTSSRNRARPGFPGYGVFAQATRQLQTLNTSQLIGDRITRRLT